MIGGTGMAAGAGAKAAVHYSTKLERHERWRQCPRCGSRKVRTERTRGFVPTAAEEPTVSRPPAEPDPVLDRQPGPATAAPADQPVSPPDPARRPRAGKNTAIAFLALLTGPVAVMYGAEAFRRAQHGPVPGGPASDQAGRRPLLAAIFGVFGTVTWLRMLVEALAVSFGAAPAAEGEASVYDIAALVVGLLVVVAVLELTRRGRFRRLDLPASLGGPQLPLPQDARDGAPRSVRGRVRHQSSGQPPPEAGPPGSSSSHLPGD